MASEIWLCGHFYFSYFSPKPKPAFWVIGLTSEVPG